MKYMLMMFGDAAPMIETQSQEWIGEMTQFMHDLNDELTQSGELVAAHGLTDSTQATTVRFENGTVATTDGPYAESKESLIGFWILDVEEEARIAEIASRVVRYSEVAEIRPIMDAPPEV